MSSGAFEWKGRLPRTLLTLGAGAFALAFAAYAAEACWRGYQACHPPRFRVTADEDRKAREQLPGLRDLELRTSDGLRLRNWYVDPKNGVCVVLVPGLAGNRASLLDEAIMLAKHGYGSLMLEPRAHGDSEGTRATWGYLESRDVIEAVKLVYAQPGVSRVGALGFSVGASAVALAAIADKSIRAVLLYATWPSLREEIAYKANSKWALRPFFIAKGYELAGVDVDAVRPEPGLKDIAPRPILMLSGAEDADTPPAIMDRVLAACAAPRELWRLPGVGHGGYLQAAPEEYERRVMSFWDRAFPDTTLTR